MYSYIVAMSYDREKVRDKIIAASEKIIEHIVKLLYYPDSSDCDHWKEEIYSFLPRVYKLKGSKKYPSKKFIFEALSGHDDAIETFTNPVINQYGDPQIDVSDSNLVSAIQSYQIYLSEVLSAQGYASPSEVYEMLDNIVDKYSRRR